jgi:hypothetical protein
MPEFLVKTSKQSLIDYSAYKLIKSVAVFELGSEQILAKIMKIVAIV